jgi:hypothetical protein
MGLGVDIILIKPDIIEIMTLTNARSIKNATVRITPSTSYSSSVGVAFDKLLTSNTIKTIIPAQHPINKAATKTKNQGGKANNIDVHQINIFYSIISTNLYLIIMTYEIDLK